MTHEHIRFRGTDNYTYCMECHEALDKPKAKIAPPAPPKRGKYPTNKVASDAKYVGEYWWSSYQKFIFDVWANDAYVWFVNKYNPEKDNIVNNLIAVSKHNTPGTPWGDFLQWFNNERGI